jgi:hypothetical protein
MNRHMKIGSTVPFLAFGVVLLWLPLTAHAFIYGAEAIEGWVTDAETGKPIEGVIVVAHWQIKGGLEGGTPINELKILETVTDQSGRYFFPAWGPKFSFLSGIFGSLLSESPEILMFKQGYKYLGVMNYTYRDRNFSESDWNKKTVKLEPFAGTLEQYAQHLSSLSSDLWTTGYGVGDHWGDYCGWKSFPNMLRALDKVDEEIKPLRVMWSTVTARLRINDAKLRSAGCGTVSELLGK